MFSDERKNCYTCSNSAKMYRKADKYVQAVLKLYDSKEELEKFNTYKKWESAWKKKKKIN